MNLSSHNETELEAIALLVKANESTPKERDHVKLRVSEYAWSWITQTAQQYKYLTGKHNARGVSRFLTDLVKAGFSDARDNFLRETDQWYDPFNVPRQRRVNLDAATRQAYINLADRWCITPYPIQQQTMSGLRARADTAAAVRVFSQASRISPVIEAIGLRWLVPAGEIQPALPKMHVSIKVHTI